MKRMIEWLVRKPAAATQSSLHLLPESVAYSALLACGCEGTDMPSFADFVAGIDPRSPRCNTDQLALPCRINN